MSNDTAQENMLYFNGINGATGDYGLPPMTGEELSGFIQGEAEPENLSELRFRFQQKDQEHFGLKEGADPKNLAESGWGIIFAHDADPALKETLSPLLELRQGQAGEHYRLYEKDAGYRVAKDTKSSFLARHGAGPGPADPEKVPYYLLIVGSPEKISYRFQSQLDVQYAVGRLDFGDDLDAYHNYATSVVEAESGQVKLSRQVSFFGVANDDDQATGLSSEHMVSPLVKHLKEKQADWEINAFLKDAAKKEQLSQLLGGKQTPALLFTASHGMEFPIGDKRQIPHQGALLCQDWPGPNVWRGKGAIPQDLYFAGDDIPSNANLLGLLGFFFACYGGGTPKFDEFAKQAFKNRAEIAPHAFLAGLPTRMLSNPGGGALAVIGHVERAWGYSFMWQGAGPQTTVFESTLDRLLDGHPVGSAIEYLNERYAELSTVLSDELEEIEFGKQTDPYELAGMWTANNDARGYTIIGDPAVRLPVVEVGQEPEDRPLIQLKSAPVSSPVQSQVEAETPPIVKTPLHVSTASTVPDDVTINFGLSDTASNLATSLQDVSQKLVGMLTTAVDDMTSLEIHTYTSADLSTVSYDPKNHKFSPEAKLQALTRISLDGDILNLLPQRQRKSVEGDDGQVEVEINEQLWTTHREMVDLAQTNKVAFVKAMAEIAGTLLKALK